MAIKDFSHLLSLEAKARKDSVLKTAATKYYGDPNIVFLGAGLPVKELFPFKKLDLSYPSMEKIHSILDRESNIALSINDGSVNDISLSAGLQYGPSTGLLEPREYLREHTKIVHNMKYDDWDVTSTIGSTHAWDAIARIFCDPGDIVLVEEFTYPTILEAINPIGIKAASIKMDEHGIIPSALEIMLENWPKDVKRPKLLYTIPTGQNPTGSTLTDERRSKIYELSCKYDFLIVEDEPYYFLQMTPYKRKPEREPHSTNPQQITHSNFIASLAKSFISLDTEGRVLRLDSFSKVLAPGARFGWVTAQKELLIHIVRYMEVTVQTPSGLSQMYVNGILQRWGQEGYLNWLIGLRHEYTIKRDFTMDILYESFPLDVVQIYPPTAGMFFILKFDSSQHPKFETEYKKNKLLVEKAINDQSIKQGCSMIIGSPYEAESVIQGISTESDYSIFFRGTYAAVGFEELALGLRRFCKAIKIEYELE